MSKNALKTVILLAAIGGLVWCAVLGSRLTTAQADLTDAKQQNLQVAADLRETNARLKVTTDEMASHASLPTMVVSSATKTGTKVAANTPPMTMSVMMLGVVLARL